MQRYSEGDDDLTEDLLNEYTSQGYEVYRIDDETIIFRLPKTIKIEENKHD